MLYNNNFNYIMDFVISPVFLLKKSGHNAFNLLGTHIVFSY